MAKVDCSEYDIRMAELALYVAQNPKFKTVSAVSQEMSRLLDTEVHPHIVADSVALYVKKGRAAVQDEIAKNMSNIVKEASRISGKNKQLERAKMEVESGVFTTPTKRTPAAKTEILQALDNALKPLKRNKREKLAAEKLRKDIESLRHQLTTGVYEVKPSRKEIKINDDLLKLRKTKRILSNKVRARINEANESRTYRAFRELNGALRTMGASGDLPLGRQGAFYFYSSLIFHPKDLTKVITGTLTQTWSEKTMNRVEEAWTQDPQYEDLVRLKLIRDSEEGFEDMDFVSKIPALGYLYRVSARQQHMMLTNMRINMYKDMAWGMPLDGVPTEQQKQDIARHILVATGVGQSKFVDKNARELAQIFFAPKYTISRFQLIGGYAYWKADPQVKKLIMKEYLRMLTGYAAFQFALTLLAGQAYKDQIDPTSANFSKPRQGHVRIDTGGGVPSILVPFWQAISGTFTSSSSGKKTDLDSGNFGAMTRLDPLTSFVRKRLAPLPGLFWTALAGGKNVVGQDIAPMKRTGKDWNTLEYNPTGAWNLALNTIFPYAAPTMYEIANDPESTDAWKFTTMIANAFSFGGNVYDAPGEPPLPDQNSSPTPRWKP